MDQKHPFARQVRYGSVVAMNFPVNGENGTRHLLLSYMWSINNIGDIAICPGFISLVRRVAPTLPVRVITSQTKETEAYAQTEKYLRTHFLHTSTVANPFKPLMGPPRFGDPSTAWGRFCDRWGPHKMDAFARGCLAADTAAAMAHDILGQFAGEFEADLRSTNPAALGAFEEAGFLVYASGTTFNFGRLQVRDFWTFALHFAMPVILARRMGLPYGINAQSFDAIDWPADLVLGPVFKDARFVFCRDSDSLAYLNQRALTNHVSGFRPDSTFFFDVEDDKWASSFLKAHALRDRGFLVLITRHSAPRFDPSTVWDKVGGDPTAGSVSQERQEEHMAKLREFVERWIEQTGHPVLMALETRVAAAPMRAWLDRGLSERARAAIVWLDHFWTTEQAYSVYKRARIVLSMEMHSIIMAVQSRTPTVHIPFREAGRKARMLEDIGLGDWLLDVDDMSVGDLLDVCRRIDRDFDASVERTHAAMALTEKLGRDVLEHIGTAWKHEAPLLA